MKNSLKRIPFMMAILSLMIFISCQTEENLVGKPLNPENTTLKFISKKDMMENKKVLKEYLNVEKKIELRKTAKMMYNSQYDFYMDTDKILYVENGDYNSYTIPIFRETVGEGKTENLIFNLEYEGYKTYIFRYNLSNNDKFNIANELTVDLTDKIEVVQMQTNYLDDNIVVGSDGNCYNIIYHPAQINAQGQVEFSYVEVVQVNCPPGMGGGSSGSTDGSSSGDGNSSGGNGDGGTDGGYNNGGEPRPGEGSGGDPLLGGSSPTLITKPNVTVADPCLSLEGPSFYETLSDTQKEWWDNPDNFEKATQLSSLLSDSGCSPSKKSIVLGLIDMENEDDVKFTLDSSVNSQNSLVFDNVTELRNYLISNDGVIGSDFQVLQQGNEKIASNKFEYPIHSIKVDIKQQITPTYKILSVNSYKTGVTFLLEWNQTNYASTVLGNTVTIDVFGTVSYGVKIGSFDGLTITVDIHYQIIIDKTTGEIISAVQLP